MSLKGTTATHPFFLLVKCDGCSCLQKTAVLQCWLIGTETKWMGSWYLAIWMDTRACWWEWVCQRCGFKCRTCSCGALCNNVCGHSFVFPKICALYLGVFIYCSSGIAASASWVFFLSIQSVDVCVNSWVTSSVLALGSPGHFHFCFLLWKMASLMIVGAYVRALWNSWVICYSRFAKSLFFFINISYSFFPPFT